MMEGSTGQSPANETPVSRFHARELDVIRRSVEGGNDYAILDAEVYCGRNELPQPEWLWRAERKCALDALLGRVPVKVGRAANPLARLRQDMIHAARWDAVNEVRDKQKEIRQQVEDMDAMSDPPRNYLEQRRHELAQIGSTRRDACEFAPRLLIGCESYAGADAFEHSYKIVRRSFKDPKQVMRFRFPSDVTLRELGLYYVFHPRPGTKLRSLFDPMI